jgi:hypothetical protein
MRGIKRNYIQILRQILPEDTNSWDQTYGINMKIMLKHNSEKYDVKIWTD